MQFFDLDVIAASAGEAEVRLIKPCCPSESRATYGSAELAGLFTTSGSRFWGEASPPLGESI